MKNDSFNVVPMDQILRKKLEVVGIANRCGTQTAVIKTGIPDRTIRHWKALFNKLGIEGLKTKSKAPKHVHNKKDKLKVLEIALIRLQREEPGLTRLQTKVILLAEPTEDVVSVSWISRARKRLGLTRKVKVKTNPHKTRYEIKELGFLQIDTKEVPASSLTNPENKLYQFTAIDECTRVRFLMGSDTKSKSAATRFLENAVKFYGAMGIYVVRAQTDNGTEYTLPQNEHTMRSYAEGNTEDAMFTQKCAELGIRHRLIKPRTPELNGKVERSHRVDGERFYSRFIFKDHLELDHALKNVWLPEYNERRPHSSLQYKTPMQFLQEKIIQIQNEKQKALEITQPTEIKEAA